MEEVIGNIVEDSDIQFKWLLLATSIDSNDDAQELLCDIVQLWITIRGFSIAAAWMEAYKQATKQTKRKSVSLRKHLS